MGALEALFATTIFCEFLWPNPLVVNQAQDEIFDGTSPLVPFDVMCDVPYFSLPRRRLISVNSQARAKLQSRRAVGSEIPRTSAASHRVRPTK